MSPHDEIGTADTRSTGARSTTGELAPAGYELGALLGRGGMGEVLLADDQRIGRKVAIKRMRTLEPTPDDVDRFLREAKIQARLDHPAIVPVHELGHDSEGRPYFTMKCLAGTTLAHVLHAGDVPLQRLLRAFAEVCLAIEYAHAKQVIHRDLKPANIMLGDFGEVYVLDWGVARVIGEEDRRYSGIMATASPQTMTGALLGTPGYMPPEQVRGEQVGPHADVYALGAILFEILAGEPLHARTDDVLASTLASPTASPGQRRADRGIAPELDAACVLALAGDPAERPSARQLADKVQRYLDGDRDLERRRQLAARLVVEARSALAAGPTYRAKAMKAAARALALDPESSDAGELVSSLMLEPPAEMPPDLVAQIDRADRALFRTQGAYSAVAILGYFLILPVVLWMGVRQPLVVATGFALVLAIAAIAARAGRSEQPRLGLAVVLNILLMMVLTRWTGPFMIVPGLTCAVTVAVLSFPPMLARYKLVIAGMLMGIVVPVVLELAHVLPKTWDVREGEIVSLSTAVDFHGTSALVFLLVSNLGMIIVLGLFARSLAASGRGANRRLQAQAWHLSQLLPAT